MSLLNNPYNDLETLRLVRLEKTLPDYTDKWAVPESHVGCCNIMET